jgi:hypothetical protein
MKSILKIAVGVFLGLTAIIIVFSIPRWIRVKNEREALKAQEARRVYAFQFVQNLSPDKVVASCGKPIINSVNELRTIGSAWQTLGYERKDGKISTGIAIEFQRDDQNRWTFYGWHYGVGMAPADISFPWEKDVDKLLDMLPCLEGK